MEKLIKIIKEEISNHITEVTSTKTLVFRYITEAGEYKLITDHFETTPVFVSLKRGRRDYYYYNNKPIRTTDRYQAIDKMLEMGDTNETEMRFEIDGEYKFMANPK